MTHPTSTLRSGLLLALTLPLFHSVTLAQALSHVVLPNGTAAADAVGFNTLPWGRATLGAARVQMLYDTSHFTAQGVTQPIRIMNLRWRANGATASWTGGLYQLITVSMTSSPRDASTPSNTWTTNQGADNTVVYNGTVVFLAGSATTGAIGPTVVDLNLTTPFVFDPSLGQDLLIEVNMPSGQWQGGTAVATDALTSAPGTGRVSATNASAGNSTPSRGPTSGATLAAAVISAPQMVLD